MDITATLKDLEDQKADLLEHIARLVKVRGDLLLPDGANRVREEIASLESHAAKLRAEIEGARGRAAKIVADAEEAAKVFSWDAAARAQAVTAEAETRRAEAARFVDAKMDELKGREAKLGEAVRDLDRRAVAFEARVKRFGDERKHLASLIRPFIEELER